jgi:nitric oxide reductase NorQ protein
MKDMIQFVTTLSEAKNWESANGNLPVKNEASKLQDRSVFLDWGNAVSKLTHCYKNDIFPILIGPKGVGKTAAIRKACEQLDKELYTVNFSLRTREHNLVGHYDTRPDGTLHFTPGPLIRSMQEGTALYLDEINVAEPSVLIRLDEALDFRRELNNEGEKIKAMKGWWVCSSINPLDRYHSGTHELPGQLLSRFPVRIYMTYPDPATEYEIVKMHLPEITRIASDFQDLLLAINQLRELDLPYTPSIRESIALAKLLISGIDMKSAVEMTLIDVYYQWDTSIVDSVKELLRSRLPVNFDP